ncbi:MAG: DUF934 domain-containing protein [Pseudomonadota bacterium]
MPIVRKTGFEADEWSREEAAARRILPLEDALKALGQGASGVALDLPNDADATRLAPHLDRIALIAVAFPAFSDGRGFSLAQRLRSLGYWGVLRASGALIPDQFAYALVCGFDEVEIDADRAARQGEAQWLADVNRPGWYQRALIKPEAAMA